MVAPEVWHLVLELPEPIQYLAGQYGSFLIENNRRPYSFASLPATTTVEFIIGTKAKGVGSIFTENLSLGDAVDFLSPYGRFTLNIESPRPILFVATGTGIAPVYAQILQALQATPEKSVTLIYGNYTPSHIIFHQRFLDLATHYSNFKYIPTCSEPTSDWQGEKRLVTQLAPEQILNVADYDIYICGNPNMVKDMKSVLAEKNVPVEQVFSEAFN